jgi:hypothetical protein
MHTPAQSWPTTPQAAAILSRITPDDLHVVTERPIVGPDYLALSPITEGMLGWWEALEAERHNATNAAFGVTFGEAQDAGRAVAWIEFYKTVPTVADALADRFGDPRVYGRTDPHTATLLWRNDARAALTTARAA